MKSKTIPGRVHVVTPPSDETESTKSGESKKPDKPNGTALKTSGAPAGIKEVPSSGSSGSKKTQKRNAAKADSTKKPIVSENTQTPARLQTANDAVVDKTTGLSGSSGEETGFRRISGGRGVEVVRTLAQIRDRLKRSEAERFELLKELREYRNAMADLEEKAEKAEKKFREIEKKIEKGSKKESELAKRQAGFEKTVKQAEERIMKAAENQSEIDRRLKEAEERQEAIDGRLDESITEQARLDRKIEKTSQDKARLLRKIERLEEIVTQTQDAMRAKAMVLLTDRSIASNFPALEDGTGAGVHASDGQIDGHSFAENETPWWKKSGFLQSAGMAAMVVAALILGWSMNRMQSNEIPRIAIMEDGTISRLNPDSNRWEPVTGNNAGKAKSFVGVDTVDTKDTKESKKNSASPDNETIKPEPVSANGESQQGNTQVNADDVTKYSDKELLDALENDPDKLAGQLNAIEPGVKKALDIEEEEKASKYLSDTAFSHDPSVEKEIKGSRDDRPLKKRIKPDKSLPENIKNMEEQAFNGNAEAQHDLAALYTAGRDGVPQNFERAALWFRESAENGISNAMYNLGVLYHQGLGVERDLKKALYWYREAAKLGHPEAQYNLGIAHIEGIGTEYNPELAESFFKAAAENGVMEAAYNLGLIYENGLAGPPRPDEALIWYKIASDKGSADAMAAMERLASSLQIGMEDIDKMAKEKKESIASSEQMEVEPAYSTAIVTQLQRQLSLRGLYSGDADGIYGSGTKAAIEEYQRKNSMKVDGIPSKDILSHMLFEKEAE